MVICADDTGVGAAGDDASGVVVVGMGVADVGCGGVDASLTIFAPCMFGSILGKRELPLRIFRPGRSFQLIAAAGKKTEGFHANPICLKISSPLLGIKG
jgi:hypothetical protein